MTDETSFGEPTQIHQEGMTFGFEWERDSRPLARVMVQDVRQDGDAIQGDVTVWWLLDQPLGVRAIVPKSITKLNTSHATGWKSIAKMASDRVVGIDWVEAISVVVQECMERLETGSPNVRLGEAEVQDDEPFILKPFIANSGTTVIYGEGGLSKSLIALAMGLSVSTGAPIFGHEPHTVGPVMYFDYEDDSSAHDRRIRALCASFGIPLNEVDIYHHALISKVTSAKREMRKRVQETGAVLGILDSVGMGRGGSAIAAEDTIRMFRGLREVGVPFLAVDHVSKASKDSKGGDVDAYGSIYTMNSARLGWSLIRQPTNDGKIHIHATNRKANHVPTQAPKSIVIEYKNDDRGVPQHIDIEMGNEFGLTMPTIGTHERVMMWLAGSDNEWMTYAELGEVLGIEPKTIARMVARDSNANPPTFEVEINAGKPTRVRCDKGVVSPLVSPPKEDGEDDETQ